MESQLSNNTIRTLSIDAIQQANSGHPEYRWTSGVECSAGPLGQGVAMSVEMAIASKWLAARHNRPGFDLFDYGFCLGLGQEPALFSPDPKGLGGRESTSQVPNAVAILGVKTFGVSAPLEVLQKRFGFTEESVVAAAKEQPAKTG